MANSVELALGLRARGLSVIPVPRPDARHDGKKPSISWREYQDRLPTVDELTRWFATEMNLAVITGRVSGVVVIDADSQAALAWVYRHLPFTPWQTKTARGYHLYYRHPGLPVGNRAHIKTGDGALALDVRGDGGYVIAPGSVHASGSVYEEAGDWSVLRARLPLFWSGWLKVPSRQTSPAQQKSRVARPRLDVVGRAQRYLVAITSPEIGAGSDVAVFSAACHLVRGFALDESTAIELLWEWAGGRPGWTREWIASKVASAIKNGREPVGGLLS